MSNSKILENNNLKGIIVPMITPFKKNGDPDKRAIRELVRYLKTKAHGLLINGTYGSGPLMLLRERKNVLEIIMEEVNSSIPVTVNISTTSTRHSIELGEHALKTGVIGLNSTPPYYFRHSEKTVEDYFVILIESLHTNIYFYNIPSFTQFNINAALLLRLAKGGLKGIKDSSENILNFYKYLITLKSIIDFQCIIGTEALMLPAVLQGAPACISGMCNYLPDLVMKMWSEIKKSNFTEAAILQEKIIKIRDIFKTGPTISLIHKFLKRIGINSGYTRAPYPEISDEIWISIEEELKRIGVEF